jgi:hypothetical protein
MSVILCEFCNKEAVYVDAKKEVPFCDKKGCYEKSKQKSLRNPLNLTQMILNNTAFRKIIHTELMQIIIMSIEVGKGIGDFNNTQAECHGNTLQFIMVFKEKLKLRVITVIPNDVKETNPKTPLLFIWQRVKRIHWLLHPIRFISLKMKARCL